VALTTYGVSGGGYNGELDFEENQFFAGDGDWNFSGSGVENMGIIGFFSATNAAVTRTNLGLGAFDTTDGFAVLKDAGGNEVLNTEDGIVLLREIFFVGTNAAQNAAFTRINLGLGSFTSDDGFSVIADESNNAVISTENGIPLFYSALTFTTTNAAATTRTNLGLGATWLTNTNISSFREAINLGTNIAYFDKISMFTEDRGTITPPPAPSDDEQEIIVYARGLSNNIVLNVAAFGAGNYTVAFEERLGSWAKTTNASIARTNLGLGGGITTNRTFVSYDGTNYTTNSVTISNGIITGWTQ
jgi:hypothetical protein